MSDEGFCLDDPFTCDEYCAKAAEEIYAYDDILAKTDLGRFIRVKLTDLVFAVKVKDPASGLLLVSFKSYADVKKMLSMIVIDNMGKKKITAFSVLDNNIGYFNVPGFGLLPDDETLLNIFGGFRYGNLERSPEDDDSEAVAIINSFIKDTICSGNEDVFDYLIKWIAAIVQYPGCPTHVAIVLQGLPGTGKSVFLRLLVQLFQGYSYSCSSVDDFLSGFNAVLEGKILIAADDNGKKISNKNLHCLYSLITDDTIELRTKYQKARNIISTQNYIIASNDSVEFVRPGDHRFLVLEPSSNHQGDNEFFGKLTDLLEGGGYEAFMQMLQSMDIDNFYPNKLIPETEAKKDLCSLSASNVERFIAANYKLFQEGFQCRKAWQKYAAMNEVKDSRPGSKSNEEFSIEVTRWCDKETNDTDGKKHSYYRLKSELAKLIEPLAKKTEALN